MPPDPGSVYKDDASVGDEEILYRLVKHANTKYEGDRAVRAASNAFQDYPADRLAQVGVRATAVSVHLKSILEEHDLTAQDLVANWGPEYGVVSVTAGQARDAEQGVTLWPTEAEPAHAMIFCLSGSKKTNGQSKRLAKASVVVIPPPSPA